MRPRRPRLAASRIKDIVQFEGVRENKLVGYGLVVGLAGTGDSLRNAPMTQQSLESMLERLGVNTRSAANFDTKNVAAVMVTASLPAFTAAGSAIDVTVSAMGDAKSLQGGTLLVTPLLGADGEAYAVAQGTVQTGSISASRRVGLLGHQGRADRRPHRRRGQRRARDRLPAGQDEPAAPVAAQSRLHHLAPHRRRDQRPAIRAPRLAENPTIVAIRPPDGRDMVSFVTAIEDLEVEPEAPAKVIIDEVAGVVVMGEHVRLSTVAIAQGNLTIIGPGDAPGQPAGALLARARPRPSPRSQVSVDEEKGKKLLVVQEGASLATLVAGLNALGVTPRDMISILQAIKAAGALQADIEVM